MRRNLVIYVAYANGVSQGVLADVFGLPQPCISVIVRDMREGLGPRGVRGPFGQDEP